jgi:hypothetical protein
MGIKLQIGSLTILPESISAINRGENGSAQGISLTIANRKSTFFKTT